ncbi:hypothetical protein [Shewanella chilikensis]|uniref:hypothetical protein n=1 Tax=Shewanella chilikensis TaxID=558541 RepID=UPI001F1C13B5|nr:hypothetical protein [Shewanella chilikensis]MCE9786155.1 hypothetical protein [Shewanella chilikensis]
MKNIILFSLFMFTSLQVLATNLIDKFDYIGNKTFSCIQCTKSEIENHARITHQNIEVGSYNYKYVATSGVYDVSVRVNPSELGTSEPEYTNASARATLNSQYTSAKLSLDTSLEELTAAFNAGYEVGTDFTYESVYEVLTEKNASKSIFNYYIKTERRTATKIQNVRTAGEILAASISVSAGALVQAQAKNVDGAYITVTFSDGTSIEVKVTIVLVDGVPTIKVVDFGDAYNADGTPVPLSPTQVNASYSNFHASFTDYLINIGVNVSFDDFGGGGGSCTTEMTCTDRGSETHCVFVVSDC